MAYDSEQVDDTLWKELLSINPDLEKDKKVINIKNYLKKGGKNGKPGSKNDRPGIR